jgi:hypothetical protein
MATVAISGRVQCYALKADVGAPLTNPCVRGLLRLTRVSLLLFNGGC